MAWNTQTFSVGQILTAAQMTILNDNITALANGDSGAPQIKAGTLIGNSFSTGSQSITNSSVYVPAAGVYQFAAGSTGAGGSIGYLNMEVLIGGTWRVMNWGTSATDDLGLGLLICDGTNMRIRNSSGSTKTLYWQKFIV